MQTEMDPARVQWCLSDRPNQSLKWLRDHRRKVDKASDFGFFGDRNDSGVFEAAGNFTQLQWSVEDLCEDGGQLVRADF